MEINMNRPAILLLITAVSLLGCTSGATPDRSTTSPETESSTLTQQGEEFGRLPRDRSKPVPTKSEIVTAWQKRQDAVKAFRFAWTEQQSHPKGWLPNPRFRQPEWLNIPGLLIDRNYAVSKTLAVDGNKMRYTFELDRKEEPDGVEVLAPQGDNKGLGVRRKYSYVSIFDGQMGKISLSSLTGSPPPTIRQEASNVDAQNLDTRAILMSLRPLDPVMGHLLIERAVTNEGRRFYKGRSTMLLEERHDPSGWKTMLWIEPERHFLVSRYDVYFEQKLIVAIDIDYVEDARWGWIPNGWRVTEMLADETMRLIAEAKVSGYSMNQPIGLEEFH
jgi:hypothetical protein